MCLDLKSCCVCVCVCVRGGGGTQRINMRLSCRLLREMKPYLIRKPADRRRNHNKHSHEAQKHLDTIIAGEIITSIFYNLIDCNFTTPF